jgi:5'-nucleotidase
MKILLTNDDGIHAPGLWALYRALTEQNEVRVVAPDRERSAVGHGITLHQPIRSQKVRVNGGQPGIAVSGTPADCVKLGLAELLERSPELVVSGINPGANVGVNVSYSGTVAAAKEAAMAGIPAMAVSITAPGERYMDAVAKAVATLCSQMVDWQIPAGTFLNVNFPDLPLEKVRGVRWSRQGANGRVQHFEKRRDPRNRTYYWQGCDAQGHYEHPDIDGAALSARYISITPIKCDMTDYDALRELSRKDISIGN